MRRTHIRLIVILGMIAITGIIVFQVVFIGITWKLNERQFTQSVRIALKNVAEKVFIYNYVQAPNNNPVVQLSPSYFVVNINSEIDANILEYYLLTEFDNLSLDVDFEYAIYNCTTDEMVYGDYINKSGKELESFGQGALPTYDEYVYYFGVNFPTRKSYLIGELSIWTIFSVILLFVVIFLGYSLFIILQQKRLSELQKDFIDNMTHEFKTPISTVLISSDVLLNKETWDNKDRLQVYADIIKKETERLNSQIERVLQITRLEKLGFELRKEQFDVHRILKEIIQNFTTEANTNNIRFECKLESKKSIVLADKLHFTNIIFNLIDNAIKYSSEHLEIKVLTEDCDRHLCLSIIDNGIGIEAKHIKYIFKKFYRVPTENIHNVKGFGLGLYYVKNICRKHGWKIDVKSQPNKGTHFIIQIPSK